MKKFRKISALALALVLICALAVSAFAATGTERNATCGSVVYTVRLEGTIDYATASVVVYQSGTKNFSGSIVLDYVYCDETMVRPSNYVYASVTRVFTKFTVSTNGSRTVECPSGNVMIEASADYQIVEQTTSTTTTITNTTLSLGLY